jgi:hypothetical protein
MLSLFKKFKTPLNSRRKKTVLHQKLKRRVKSRLDFFTDHCAFVEMALVKEIRTIYIKGLKQVPLFFCSQHFYFEADLKMENCN